MASAGGEIVLALDIGTGGARATAYDLRGTQVATSSYDYATYYDHPSWSEQDSADWWRAAHAVLRAIMAQLTSRHVCAIGLTGQSPTIVPVDRARRPLRRGMLYQDNRAVREAQDWAEVLGGPATAHRLSGHAPAAFYIGPKMVWVRKHEPGVWDTTDVWLQPRDFVAYQLTGRTATDWSHAGSTLLFDVSKRTWADTAFDTLAIPRAMVPEALPPWTIVGEVGGGVADDVGIGHHTPVVIGGVDSQCCTVGAGVLRSDELSDMAGTSTCLNAPVPSPLQDLRIANYCHVVPGWWCTELGLNASGAAFEWVTGILSEPGAEPAFVQCEAAAARADPGAQGLIFLPYLADGERFDPTLRGGFCGLSLRHGRGELTRAVLEGVAFAIRAHLEVMAEAGAPIGEIHVSGGGARSAVWNQIKADVTGVPVVAVASDATSLGVALVAGTAVGVFSSIEEAVDQCVRLTRRYEPERQLRSLYDDTFARFEALGRATALSPAES